MEAKSSPPHAQRLFGHVAGMPVTCEFRPASEISDRTRCAAISAASSIIGLVYCGLLRGVTCCDRSSGDRDLFGGSICHDLIPGSAPGQNERDRNVKKYPHNITLHWVGIA
jgi:hypothetical protein